MKIQVRARVLTSESKPYNVDGNEGISHRVRLAVDGEIYPVKSTETQVIEFKDYVGKFADVELEINSRKEALSLAIDSVSNVSEQE